MTGIDKILKALNLLQGNPSDAVKVNEQGEIIELMDNSIPYFEIQELLIDALGDIDDGSKDEIIAKLKAKHDDLKTRWENDETVTLKEFVYITGLSRDMVEKFIGYNPVHLKYYQAGKGAKIFFKRSDWLEFQKYIQQ